MDVAGRHYRTIWLSEDDPGAVQIIDQRWLPHRFVVESLTSYRDGVAAIREMHVRGAPLIGATAAWSLYLAARESHDTGRDLVRDAAELRVKEVDRISVLTREFGKMGGHFVERSDGFELKGPIHLRGAEVDSHGDHRMGMALAVAGLIAEGETIVHHADCINDSFPGFVDAMRAIGADMEWEAT